MNLLEFDMVDSIVWMASLKPCINGQMCSAHIRPDIDWKPEAEDPTLIEACRGLADKLALTEGRVVAYHDKAIERFIYKDGKLE